MPGTLPGNRDRAVSKTDDMLCSCRIYNLASRIDSRHTGKEPSVLSAMKDRKQGDRTLIEESFFT